MAGTAHERKRARAAGPCHKPVVAWKSLVGVVKITFLCTLNVHKGLQAVIKSVFYTTTTVHTDAAVGKSLLTTAITKTVSKWQRSHQIEAKKLECKRFLISYSSQVLCKARLLLELMVVRLYLKREVCIPSEDGGITENKLTNFNSLICVRSRRLAGLDIRLLVASMHSHQDSFRGNIAAAITTQE